MAASHQWFINTDKLKPAAIDEIERVEFHPVPSLKKDLISRLDSRPYWCISRQRAWGTPIPVFYRKSNGEPIIHKGIVDALCAKMEEHGNIDFWWTQDVAELVPADVLNELQLKASDLTKGEDILDIWFDSGVSWSYALDEPQLADLYLEGQDQLTGWFQSSLMTSIACRGRAPFK